ncbi:MAG TPA: daunorubicin/doxorubicin resistance ABC transporter ATP-binding protein DrrA, partial [Candidatus Limnocylindria bacterium]|nr:daunorubicin/doxorubicin resistance ABC transporter ATP-binding protein DrrA [Candidatus Limnocylindria bacterium]
RMAAIAELVTALGDGGIGVEDLGIRRPTLDEVFLQLTGHAATAPAAGSTRDAAQEAAA